MSNKVQVDQAVLRILYYRYKDYIVPFIAFVVSWFIFIQFAVPQLQVFLAEKDQVVANEQTLAVMTQNYNLIVSQKNTELESFLQTATAALPQNKDFAGILTAISNAAGLSGVILNDYTFQIGDLNNQLASRDQQSVKINLTINGSLEQTKKFLVSLQQQFPISEVTDVTMLNGASASMNASFYYSPLPTITFVDTNPIVLLSATEKSMLQGLIGNIQTGNISVTPVVTQASSSAKPSPTSVISPTTGVSSSSAKF